MRPGCRPAIRVEAGRQAVVVVRSVEVVLDVFLATPNDFHRAAHLPGDFHREERTVCLESPAETAAQEVAVDLDGFLGEADHLRNQRLRQRWRLSTNPDVTLTLI